MQHLLFGLPAPPETVAISTLAEGSNSLFNNLIQNNSKSFYYKKIGNTHAFFSNQNGDPILILGPHWPFYFLTMFTISMFYFLIYKIFYFYINESYKIIGYFLFGFFFLSYTFSSFINPGFPKNSIEAIKGEPRKLFEYCEICEIWNKKEKNVKHCEMCDICIEGLDHHCYWISKCVGKRNLYAFYFFLFVCLFIILYFMCLFLNIKKLVKLQHNKDFE